MAVYFVGSIVLMGADDANVFLGFGGHKTELHQDTLSTVPLLQKQREAKKWPFKALARTFYFISRRASMDENNQKTG